MAEDDKTEETSVEQDILTSIGEGNETTDDTTTTDTEEGETSETTQQSDVAVSTDSTDSKGSDVKQEVPAASSPQDLKLNDGTVIKGGAERRLYERGTKLQRDLSTANTQLAEATAKIEAFEGAGNLGSQYNLSPDELTSGAQLIAAYKSDPVATIKHMLTEAQSQGHNIEGLGGTTDMGAIKSMIQEAVQPLTRQVTQDQEEQQARTDAEKIWGDFNIEHPDATTHQDSLAQLMKDEQSLSLPAAYYKLKTMYLERNLDWSKPLATLQQEAQSNPVVNTAQSETIPSTANVNGQDIADTSEVADVDTSFDDIIRQSLKDAQIN